MCLQKSAFDGRLYLPKDCLDRILSREIIRDQLNQAQVSCEEFDALVEYIFATAGRVFLILVKLGWSSRIVGLKKHGFGDMHLPILVTRDPKPPYAAGVLVNSEDGYERYQEFQLSFDYSRSFDRSRPKNVEAFEEGDWAEDDSDIDDFANMQWSFLTPVLRRDEDRRCGRRDILPIVSIFEERQGGFSKVTRVLFHSIHIAPGVGRDQYLALKESTYDWDEEASQKDIQEMFEREVVMLNIMKGLNHDHLIEFVTSFSLDSKRFIVFPWAENGNLRGFWAQNDYQDTDSECIIWVLEQLRGLLDGIQMMHSKNCIHADLKPENLLLFRRPGARPRIVIADFGLADVYGLPTVVRRANESQTKTWWRTPRYEPPEFEESGSGHQLPRSRAYDVWSMGCVGLEFLIWLLWGHTEGLLVFHQKFPNEKFWKYSPYLVQWSQLAANKPFKKEVHPAVANAIRWMKEEDFRCGENSAIGELLSLVTNRLLVVEINRENGRAESNEVFEEVDQIYQQATPTSSYLKDSAYSTKSKEPEGDVLVEGPKFRPDRPFGFEVTPTTFDFANSKVLPSAFLGMSIREM